MSRTRLAKKFTEDLVGSSVVEATMLMLENAGPVAYVGLERIEGTMHGSTDTFVLLHPATGYQNENHGSWTIVPGSRGGELAGIRGSGEITDQHDFVLEYALDT